MNLRTSIVTAASTLVLVAPVFASSASADPWYNDLPHQKSPAKHRVVAQNQSGRSKSTTFKCSFAQTPQLCRQLI
jgi:hypothetical protein